MDARAEMTVCPALWRVLRYGPGLPIEHKRRRMGAAMVGLRRLCGIDVIVPALCSSFEVSEGRCCFFDLFEAAGRILYDEAARPQGTKGTKELAQG